jgi:hypothetical protein
MNTTGYTGGSKKLLAMSRKNKTSNVELVVGLPTTTKDTKEVYPKWIIVV